LSLVEAFLPAAAAKTEEWIKHMRDRHWATTRPIGANERNALDRHFEASLLDSTRIKEVTEIEKPPFYDGLRSQLSFVGMRFNFDFAAMSGITFGDCILVRQSPATTDLLFHELVHAAQYNLLGTARFATAYVRGFAENGFVYEEIPLEKIAYSLTDRFAANQEFRVREELSGWLAGHKY
jgi:hypothetical protein